MMSLEEFTEIIRQQFLVEDRDGVNPDVELRTLSCWDSLTGFAILSIIRDRCQVSIPIDEFMHSKTIRDLYFLVSNDTEGL